MVYVWTIRIVYCDTDCLVVIANNLYYHTLRFSLIVKFAFISHFKTILNASINTLSTVFDNTKCNDLVNFTKLQKTTANFIFDM